MSTLDPQHPQRLVTSHADQWPLEPMSPFARPSKTQRKSQLDAIKRLGEELVALTPGRLARLDLPDFLRKAVEEAQAMEAFGARKRQILTIGRMMEDLDIEAIRADLATVDQKPVAKAEEAPVDAEHAAIVERLVTEGDPAVFALEDRLDHEALSGLRQATRAARKKLAAGADPTKTRRELAQRLSGILPR
jgi:ribosome-associated protein